MKTRILPILAALVLLPAGSILAADSQFVIVQPGYPGSTSEAENFVKDLAGEISRQGGPSGVQGAYYNETGAALKAINEKQPAFGIVSLGFFLAHRKSLQLKAILECRPSGSFYLASRKDDPVSPKDLAGEKVAGTPFHEMEFVSRILFGPGAGGGPVSAGGTSDTGAKKAGEKKAEAKKGTANGGGNGESRPDGSASPKSSPGKPVADVKNWEVEASRGFSRGIRNVARGRARAVLLNARERRALSNLTAGKQLRVYYRTEELPLAMVVSFGKKVDMARKGAEALVGLKGSKEGKELLGIMGIEGFTPVDAKRLEKLMRRYQQGGAPLKGGASSGDR